MADPGGYRHDDEMRRYVSAMQRAGWRPSRTHAGDIVAWRHSNTDRRVSHREAWEHWRQTFRIFPPY